ncbi:alpha/beta fold hydrolase [Nocardia sp. BMG51109]|uniref:alpha/beta fold hydrolase n=1 Tax=Nocardia sp. BMG51109 TaxID=1056816 RepID=UPI0004667B3F|nr:alpha/beta fold hydrolase [Nocardia sp. BMG51109]
MTLRTARNGDVEIAYETFGGRAGEPLILIGGLDGQMLWWHDGFCLALAEAGFRVVRYDHRDTGLSTHFTGTGRAYRARDMIDDLFAVLTALDWDSAHLCGLSMGGGLAQHAALLNPSRIRSLILLSALPMPLTPLSFLRYTRFPGPFKGIFRRYGSSRQEQIRKQMDIIRLTEAPGRPFEESWLRATVEACMDRQPPDPRVRARQLAAGRGTKLPPGGLRAIPQPTLVISGRQDPIVKPSAGKALADRIPGARFTLIDGMGHNFTPEFWPALVAEITAHTQRISS